METSTLRPPSQSADRGGISAADLASVDKVVEDAIALERDRQCHSIELIASENFVSPAVLQAQGSVLTNKYAEGYPGKRYYQGCHPSDEVEQLAIDRAKELFDCAYINVQPHSGAQANGAIALSLDRMNKIRDIRPDARIAIVEAGVIIANLHAASAEHDLIFPLTFGARGSAMIGAFSASSSVIGRRRWAFSLRTPFAWLFTDTWAMARLRSSLPMPCLAR